MQAFANITTSFARFNRVPLPIVLGASAASLVAVAGLFMMAQPLYIIVIFAMLPWVPVLLFEGLWKIEHYGWIAVFAVFVGIHIGHLAEHVLQVGALEFADATLACPPPVDNQANAERAITLGYRDAGIAPTGITAATIVQPNASGSPVFNDAGDFISGPTACGVFGQLDIEIVHLVFELFGWFMTGILLLRFPRSVGLWIAMAFLIIHTFEHVFISYLYFFDTEATFAGTLQSWATIIEGGLVTAIPVEKVDAIVPFYDVAGKFGIAARNGLLGTMFPDLNPMLPERPYLHFYYNMLVVVPTTFAFISVLRQTYDKYLAIALPSLTQEELVEITTRLNVEHFRTGEIIIKQGTITDGFYVISKGVVEVVQERQNAPDDVIVNLEAGQYFGEISARKQTPRTATVRALTDVEVLRLNQKDFEDLVSRSELSRDEIDAQVADRVTAIYERYIMQALPTLSASELQRVANRTDYVQHEVGDIIVRKGDIGNDFYIITDGEVEVINDNNETIATLKHGQYFGEIALRRDSVRQATVRAKTAVHLLKLSKHEFDDLMVASQLSRDEIDRRMAMRVEQLINKYVEK